MKKGIDLPQGLFLIMVLLKFGHKVNISYLLLLAPLVVGYLYNFLILGLVMVGIDVNIEMWIVKKYAAWKQKQAIREGNRIVEKMAKRKF